MQRTTSSPVKKRKSPSTDTNVFGDNTNQREVGASALKRKKGEEGSIDASDEKQVIGPVLYSPGELLPKLDSYIGSVIEVRVPVEHLSLRNPQISTRQLWGSGEYTSDSDVVAIVQHSGSYELKESPPALAFLKVYLNITAGKPEYSASNAHETLKQKNKHLLPSKWYISFRTDLTIQMDLASVVLPNTMMKFNLSNELSFQYDLTLLCDRGTQREKWTSYKLKSFVLFLETATERYELSKDGVKKINDKTYDSYRWTKVNNPLFLSQSHFGKYSKISGTTFLIPEQNSIPLPLSEDHITALHSGLDWSEFLWGTDSLLLKGQHYPVETLFWLPRTTTR